MIQLTGAVYKKNPKLAKSKVQVLSKHLKDTLHFNRQEY